MNFRITIKGAQIQKMTDDEFLAFCEANDGLKIERLPDRKIVIEELRTLASSELTLGIIGQLSRWSNTYKIGKCITPKKGFVLEDGTIRNPTAAWICNERLKTLGHAESPNVVRACPDFVIEMKERNEEIMPLKSRMRTWIRGGCKLAWLIDPKKEVVHIFDPKRQRMHIGFDKPVSAEFLLPGFQLQLYQKPSRGIPSWK